MSTVLQTLSTELANAVASAGRAVVAIHARRRIPASGVQWRPGVVVATNHTISREENITVALPDGTTAPATLVGRDPSTDLAVLKLGGQTLPPPRLRPDPLPTVGELVIALGRPGPSLTASWGVVSRVDGPGGRLDNLARLEILEVPPARLVSHERVSSWASQMLPISRLRAGLMRRSPRRARGQ